MTTEVPARDAVVTLFVRRGLREDVAAEVRARVLPRSDASIKVYKRLFAGTMWNVVECIRL